MQSDQYLTNLLNYKKDIFANLDHQFVSWQPDGWEGGGVIRISERVRES